MIIASASVGAGHNQAARALLAGLKEADPGIEAQWVDVLDLSNPLFRLYYAGGYATMVARLPRTYGLGYRITDRPRGARRTLAEKRRLLNEWIAVRRFRHWLAEQAPAVVVNTHFLPCPMIARMIDRGATGLRQMVVVTDHHMHRFWCSEGVDRYFVPDTHAVDRLGDFGVDSSRVEVTGLPIHPKWTAPLDESKIRADWKLPVDAPVIVLSGGVDFTVGRVDKLAAEICRRVPNAVVLVLAGRNKKLLGRLAAAPQAVGDNPRLRPVGFTDRIHELMHIAHLVVTKTGGMTVYECLAKGAAMVLLKPVPGQETHNARWLCENNAAVQAADIEEVIAQTVGLMSDPARLAALRRNAAGLAKPATETIVTRVLEAIGPGADAGTDTGRQRG